MKTIYISVLIFLIHLQLHAQDLGPISPMGGGEVYIPTEANCLSDAQRAVIQKQLTENIAQLKAEGKITENRNTAIVAFDWPIKVADNAGYFDVYGISNFVDHDPSSGIQEYNCSTRSYDGHRGTDYFSWPFPWYLYNNDLVEIVAAEGGVIINKDDGQFDKHCSWNFSTSWNAIYVRHDDGSVAWYGHMKSGSLSSKAVGDQVEKGEFLGIMASSGISSAPHLHFEIYDTNNRLVDPYVGTCNNLNTETWWADQHEFRASGLNALFTHNREPRHGCPDQNESPFFQNSFVPGDLIYLAAYYHDQISGDPYSYRIVDPNGNTWQSWEHSSSQTYNSSWWWWSRTLPQSGPFGTWKFEVTKNNLTKSHSFEFGVMTNTEEINNPYEIQLYPNPTNGELHILANQSIDMTVNIQDHLGRVLQSFEGNITQVDLSEFANGVYLVSIQGRDFSFTQKIIKQD